MSKPVRRRITEKEKRAVTATSLSRAESLRPDVKLLERAVHHGDVLAITILAAWEPRFAWADRIVQAEVIDAR